MSLEQCGELRCGTISPHGPGFTVHSTSLIVIRASLSRLVKKLARLSLKDVKSIAGSCVESFNVTLKIK